MISASCWPQVAEVIFAHQTHLSQSGPGLRDFGLGTGPGLLNLELTPSPQSHRPVPNWLRWFLCAKVISASWVRLAEVILGSKTHLSQFETGPAGFWTWSWPWLLNLEVPPSPQTHLSQSRPGPWDCGLGAGPKFRRTVQEWCDVDGKHQRTGASPNPKPTLSLASLGPPCRTARSGCAPGNN